MAKRTTSVTATGTDKIKITGTVEVTLVNPVPPNSDRPTQWPKPVKILDNDSYADAAVITIDAGQIYKNNC